MRAFEAPPHQRYVGVVKSPIGKLTRRVAGQKPVQDLICLGVADAEVPFVGLTGNEVGRRRLRDDGLGNAEVTRQRPHLGLEQVA